MIAFVPQNYKSYCKRILLVSIICWQKLHMFIMKKPNDNFTLVVCLSVVFLPVWHNKGVHNISQYYNNTILAH